MANPTGFDRIEIGQRVKVKGLTADDGTLHAVEIERREPKDRTVLEGVARSIDAAARSITLMGRSVSLSEDVGPVGPDGRGVPLETLRAPVLVKIVGRYSETAGLSVESVRLKETLPFNIEKLQGRVTGIDLSRATLQIAGVTVRATPLTLVERFA